VPKHGKPYLAILLLGQAQLLRDHPRGKGRAKIDLLWIFLPVGMLGFVSLFSPVLSSFPKPIMDFSGVKRRTVFRIFGSAG
jgi:hypothetical protein